MFKLLRCLILLYLLTSKSLYAVEFRIGGYGTLGVMHSDNHLADYVTDLKPDGAGYTHDFDYGNDSLLGVQGDLIFNEMVSSALQLVHRKPNGEKDFKTTIELANIKMRINSNLSLHIGRLGFPAFIASDYRLVNYANVWARAPIEVYTQEPLTHLDGISLSYKRQLGDGVFNTQGVYFGTSGKSPQGNSSKGHGSILWNASYEKGALLGRLLFASFSLSNPDGFARFRSVLQNVPGSEGLIDRFFGPRTRGKYYSVGLTYDPGKYLLQSEYTFLDMDKGFVNTTNSWYALAAIREGKWSPYLMISKLQSEGPFEDPQSSAIANGSFGPALAPFGNVISRVIALRNQSQTTTSIGVRYDLMKNVALKVQYDHVQPNNSYGMYAYPSSQLRPAGTANIASVNLDFIF